MVVKMLNHSLYKTQSSTSFKPGFNPISDPWEEEEKPVMKTRLPRWNFRPGLHHLISPAETPHLFISSGGMPGALRLPEHTGEPINPDDAAIQTLLQEELKTKACQQHSLAEAIEQAFALLYLDKLSRTPVLQ